jgi:hypothetical protein
MNIVSFSLYGDDPKFVIGAIENAKDVQNFSDEWVAYFYCGQEVSLETRGLLEGFGAKVIVADSGWHVNGMFWRFYPFGNEVFKRVIIRDVDSRISHREFVAIQEWADSGKLGHIMRDHPFHATEILGGMWGARFELKNFMSAIDVESYYTASKGQDQNFLRDKVYPILAEDSLIHDSFYRHESHAKPFQLSRLNGEYIGEVIEADGTYNQSLRNRALFFEKHRFIWSARRALSSF